MKKLKFASGLLGFSGVAFGAFGAHGLQGQLALHGTTDIWEKAVIYHLVHAVAIFGAAIALQNKISDNAEPARRWLARAGACWAFGVVFFSGSLYGLALGGPRWLGPMTPVGGLLFLLGWSFVIVDSWQNKNV